MIVAAAAADRQPEEGASDRLQLFVDDVEAELGLVLFLVIRGAEREEAGGDQIPLDDGRVGRAVGGEEVTGELGRDEPIEGDVGVDCGDHPVTIAPRILEEERATAAARFGESGEIEPVAAEPFAKGGIGQEAVDDFRHRSIGIAGMRRDEGVGLLGGRWQAGEVLADPPEEPLRGGLRVRPEAGGIEASADEAVDRMPVPVGIGHLRRRRIRQRQETPKPSPLVGRHPLGRAGKETRAWPDRAATGIVGPTAHPSLDDRDLLRRELAVGGHLGRPGIPADRAHQQALVRLPRHDRRPGVAPLCPTVTKIEAEAAVDLVVGGVARQATGRQQRHDRLGKALIDRGRPGLRRGEGRERTDGEPESTAGDRRGDRCAPAPHAPSCRHRLTPARSPDRGKRSTGFYLSAGRGSSPIHHVSGRIRSSQATIRQRRVT